MVRRILPALLGALVLLPSWAAHAEVRVQSERNPVMLDESFNLRFEVAGNPHQSPDFSPVAEHFEILSRSQSNNIQLINGQFSQQALWTLTLMPRAVGAFEIPAIAFGDEASEPLTIEVVPAAPSQSAGAGGDVFLEVSTSPERAYARSQVVLNIRVYRAVDTRNAALSEPRISGVETFVDRLGDDQVYRVQRAGRNYEVVERRYTLFPQQAGELHIAPLVFEGQVRQRFQPFRHLRERSRPLTLQVEPIPQPAPAAGAFPASEVRLVEEWQQGEGRPGATPPQLNVGEAVTRTVTLVARGMRAAQLPALMTDWPQALRHYPDQPLTDNQVDRNGIIGVRQEKTVLIPSRPGPLELPPVQVHWWDTAAKRWRLAELPARTLTVNAAPGQADRIPPADGEAAALLPAALPQAAGVWPGLSVALGVGWLATLLLWWRSRRTAPLREPRRATYDTAEGRARKQLLRMLDGADARSAAESVLAWAAARWPDRPPRSLAALGRQAPELADALQELEQALYGAAEAEWRSDALRHALARLPKPEKTTTRTDAAIPPLYPEDRG